jgi:hypothetical protein
MGFLNTNRHQVTTTTSGQGIIYNTAGSGYTVSAAKKKYHILGEDFESVQLVDIYLCMIIANINILGEPFYKELLKQEVSLPTDIDNFIQERFRILNRDKKIDGIITNKS